MQYTLKEFITPVYIGRIANIHYFEFSNHYHTKVDYHDFCELLYIDRGEITVSSKNYNGTLHNNQMIIHRPNEMHSLSCDGDVAPNVIIIGFECDCPEIEEFAHSPVTLSPEQIRMLADAMKEGMSVYAPPYDNPNTYNMQKRDVFPYGADQMIRIKLELLLISLIRENAQHTNISRYEVHDQTRIEEIYKYITENYREKILLDNICFVFGTNKTTLCKEFKQRYKTTIINHINSVKIKEAKALLREGKMTVTQISEAVGFNSHYYFIRTFKSQIGLTPKEYQKSIKAKFDQ